MKIVNFCIKLERVGFGDGGGELTGFSGAIAFEKEVFANVQCECGTSQVFLGQTCARVCICADSARGVCPQQTRGLDSFHTKKQIAEENTGIN